MVLIAITSVNSVATDGLCQVLIFLRQNWHIFLRNIIFLRIKIYNTHSIHKKKVVHYVEVQCPLQLETCVRSMLYKYRFKNNKDFVRQLIWRDFFTLYNIRFHYRYHNHSSSPKSGLKYLKWTTNDENIQRFWSVFIGIQPCLWANGALHQFS